MLVGGVLVTACVLVPRVFGAEPYVVLTSSMEPALPPGTLVVVRPVDPDEIGTGSVITYQLESGKPQTVTHRVVGVGAEGSGERVFTTRGDANDAADLEPVRAVQVRGELWYRVPWVGRFVNQVSPGHRALVEAVLVGLLLAYAAWMFGSAGRGRVRKGEDDGAQPADRRGGDPAAGRRRHGARARR